MSSIDGVSGAARFNFALESLRQNVQQEQVAASALTQGQQNSEEAGRDNDTGSVTESRGNQVNVKA